MTPEDRRNRRLDPLTWAIGVATFIVVCGAMLALIVFRNDPGGETMSARTEREALEDAFDRADGEQEIAFRNYRRAKAKNVGSLMHASLEHAKRAHRRACAFGCEAIQAALTHGQTRLRAGRARPQRSYRQSYVFLTSRSFTMPGGASGGRFCSRSGR